jgi:hypothetical protein
LKGIIMKLVTTLIALAISAAATTATAGLNRVGEATQEPSKPTDPVVVKMVAEAEKACAAKGKKLGRILADTFGGVTFQCVAKEVVSGK